MTRQERHDKVWLRDTSLPDDGPSDDIYRLTVPIWCEMTHEDLAEKLGSEYGCGVAYGIERGLILANLRPEWARGLYHLIRSHYVKRILTKTRSTGKSRRSKLCAPSRSRFLGGRSSHRLDLSQMAVHIVQIVPNVFSFRTTVDGSSDNECH